MARLATQLTLPIALAALVACGGGDAASDASVPDALAPEEYRFTARVVPSPTTSQYVVELNGVELEARADGLHGTVVYPSYADALASPPTLTLTMNDVVVDSVTGHVGVCLEVLCASSSDCGGYSTMTEEVVDYLEQGGTLVGPPDEICLRCIGDGGDGTLCH